MMWESSKESSRQRMIVHALKRNLWLLQYDPFFGGRVLHLREPCEIDWDNACSAGTLWPPYCGLWWRADDGTWNSLGTFVERRFISRYAVVERIVSAWLANVFHAVDRAQIPSLAAEEVAAAAAPASEQPVDVLLSGMESSDGGGVSGHGDVPRCYGGASDI